MRLADGKKLFDLNEALFGSGLAFSADGRKMIVSGEGPDLSSITRLWDIETCASRDLPLQDSSGEFAFSADGSHVCMISLDILDCEGIASGTKGARIELPHTPDPSTVLVARGLKAVAYRTGEVTHVVGPDGAPLGHRPGQAISFSADGETLLLGTRSFVVR